MSRVSVNSYARTHFGPRVVEDKLPSVYEGSAGEEVLEVVFSYDDLPSASLDNANLSIPANAWIKDATLRVVTAFAGGTSYNIGLSQPDGTVIDADGIDAAVATAAIDAVGETVVCDGALVGNTAGIGTAAGVVTAAATGTFTAGKAILRVTYERLDDRA